ncbi:CsbD family protein [Paracoccus sp. TK19116]|uniref:CsbD family protein n=1 Tax=Paracoccus albicereus TaxID=2922394 RepID=A0ABT1MSB7_9RHOB|nr:CsbD family protein [Paracoccus albicereus]MCQ0971205.1 CsbD family protein [Paracoccus albicereus]
MNWDIVQGKWKQLKGAAQDKWGDLTDDEFDKVEGNRERLAGKLQEKYGWSKDEAEKQIDDFARDSERY